MELSGNQRTPTTDRASHDTQSTSSAMLSSESCRRGGWREINGYAKARGGSYAVERRKELGECRALARLSPPFSPLDWYLCLEILTWKEVFSRLFPSSYGVQLLALISSPYTNVQVKRCILRRTHVILLALESLA